MLEVPVNGGQGVTSYGGGVNAAICPEKLPLGSEYALLTRLSTVIETTEPLSGVTTTG